MRIAEKLQPAICAPRGVARAALLGVTRPQLIRAAVDHLLEQGHADRVGAWTECGDYCDSADRPAAYRGFVSDYDHQFTPSQWSHLSPEPPLPFELLTERKTVQQDLDHASDLPVIGAVTEMRRALWVPVEVQGELRGLVFGGVRKRHGALLRNVFESVAGELALALEFEDEQRRSRERQEDLRSVQRFLTGMSARESVDHLVTNVVWECVAESATSTGLGAAFAVLYLPDDSAGTGGSAGQRWCAGEASAVMLFESEPVRRIWHKAVATRRTFAGDLGGGRPRGNVAQVVAVPLEVRGEIAGVLVAGWAAKKLGLRNVERVELRAGIAANLLSRDRDEREARRRRIGRHPCCSAVTKRLWCWMPQQKSSE
jgi:hypothetical protein